MEIIDLSSGISGESEEGANDGVVESSESKTLVENPGDKGVLSEGVRVSNEPKILDVESSNENVINRIRKDAFQSSRLDIRAKVDASKRKMRSQSNKWDSWGSGDLMNMVGRVLGGNLSMDDEVDDEADEVYTSENALELNMVQVEAVNNSENGCEANVIDMEDVDNSANQHEANVVEWEKDVKTLNNVREACIFENGDQSDELVVDGMVLNANQEALSNELRLDLVDLKGDCDFQCNELVPGGRGLKGAHSLELAQAIKGDQDSLSKKSAANGMGLNEGQDSLSNNLVPHDNGGINNVECGMCLMPKTRGRHQITEKEGEFYVSDLVWGKVRSHPWWPGQIILPTAASYKAKKYVKRSSYLIAYFGDQSFAWNEESNVKPFHMYFSQMEKQNSSDSFCHAVSCALDEVARRAEFGLSCQCLSEEVRDMLEIKVVSNAGIHEDKNKVDDGDNLLGPASFSPGNLVHFLESLSASPQTETDRLEVTIKKAQLLAFSRWKGHYELPVFEQYVGLFQVDAVVTDDFSSKKRKSTSGDGSSLKRRHLSGDKEFLTVKEKRISTLISSGSSILPNAYEKPIERAAQKPVSSGKNITSTNSNSRVKRKTMLPTSQIADVGKSREEPEMVEIIPSDIPTSDVILSKLTLTAKVPTQGFRVMVLEIDFIREFRNSICLEKSSSLNAVMDSAELKGKQPADIETAENTLGFEGTRDSYWTDRIIQSIYQEPVLSELKNPEDNAAQVDKPAGKVDDTLVLDLGSEQKPPDEYQPTALILNFSNLESVPSITNLNEIFNRYGPLVESETKILRKSKRVKMIFRRRADAETAFSSPGKYSIFGPSLLSYKLHYAPTTRKACESSNRAKKDGSVKVDT